MNAVELLTSEHRLHEKLLGELAESRDPEERKSLFEKFREELIKHVNMEESIFYPRLKKLPQFKQKVLEALEEHNLCMQLLQELDCTADEPVWRAKLTVLSELTLHHVKQEEEELFGLVQELASEDFLREIGSQMRMHKAATDPEKVLYPDGPKSP